MKKPKLCPGDCIVLSDMMGTMSLTISSTKDRDVKVGVFTRKDTALVVHIQEDHKICTILTSKNLCGTTGLLFLQKVE